MAYAKNISEEEPTIRIAQDRMKLHFTPGFHGAAAAIALAATLAAHPAAAGQDGNRLARRVALVRDLLEENAGAEALAEARRLRAEPFWREGALSALSARLDEAAKTAASRENTAASRENTAANHDKPATGAGSLLARAVVSFYRFAVGPAIGQRCALEPSCSQYFLDASRKHGLLGLPMIADRFIREPVVSAPDRPVVRTKSGALRHPDPVEDHDWWFAK